MHGTSQPTLTRQERFDVRISRALPKFSGRSNRLLIRLSRGRLGTSKRGIPIGLLTSTGRHTGQLRTVPLMYLADGDRYLVVNSNGGYDRPAAWFLNLVADPVAMFEPAGRVGAVPVRSRIVEDDERARLWPTLIAHNPLWAAFQTYTDRKNAVVALEPHTPDGG